jgi:hypothetical protein
MKQLKVEQWTVVLNLQLLQTKKWKDAEAEVKNYKKVL